MSATEKVFIGKVAAGDAERLKTRLARDGIEILTIHNGMSCKSGCSVQLEMWAHPEDLPDIGRIVENDRLREVVEMGADPALIESVFDPSLEQATCPACGSSFSTLRHECPECGLGFSIPNNV